MAHEAFSAPKKPWGAIARLDESFERSFSPPKKYASFIPDCKNVSPDNLAA